MPAVSRVAISWVKNRTSRRRPNFSRGNFHSPRRWGGARRRRRQQALAPQLLRRQPLGLGAQRAGAALAVGRHRAEMKRREHAGLELLGHANDLVGRGHSAATFSQPSSRNGACRSGGQLGQLAGVGVRP